MKRIAVSLLVAALGTGVSPVQAQLKPEGQTGSIIPVKPENVEAKEAGLIRKYFAQCVYARAKSKASSLLAHSDIQTIDLQAAGIKSVARELDMEHCLSEQVRVDQTALGMKFSPLILRDLLAEEAYLAAYRTPPSLPSELKPLTFTPLNPANQVETYALATFADCTVQANLSGADALLRTMPESDAERAAAAALAPSLGACLEEGQKVTLKPANIRALIAYAMWTRFVSGRVS